MPVDGLMIGSIVREMQALIGGRVDKITQPEKDAIVIAVRASGQNHRVYISASANHARLQCTARALDNPQIPPAFCMILRKHLVGARVLDIRQIGADRVAELEFEIIGELGDHEKRLLIVESMGRHSNIILCEESRRIIDSVRHVGSQMSRYREVLPGRDYIPPPAQDKRNPFTLREGDWQTLLSLPGRFAKILQENAAGISPASAREIAFRLFGDMDARTDRSDRETPSRLTRFFAEYYDLKNPTVVYDGLKPVDVSPIDVLSTAFEKKHYSDLGAALDAFFEERDAKERMDQRGGALLRLLKNHQERCERKIALQLEAIQNTENREQSRIFGELLTTYQHQLKKGDMQAILPNYYDNNAEVVIPLDPLKTPNENAQAYYKRYQKLRNASVIAVEQLEKSREELRTVEELLHALTQCQTETELVELREEAMGVGLVRASHSRKKQRKLPPSKPLHYRLRDIDVYVGKNNMQNDRLTQAARPDWAWMHVKDMPGSHLIVERDLDDLSEDDLQLCAVLAAWHSKGKNSSQVPVDIAKRRYVKKPGGAKPGYVIYTHQRTVYVQPSEENVRKFTLL